MLIAFVALAFSQPTCTPEQAVVTTIEAITATPDQWLDRCVTLSGIAGGIALYPSLEELYRTSRLGADGNAELRHRIGIDRQELRVHPQLHAHATNIKVTGHVDDCGRRAQRIIAAGGIPFLSGYCHYNSGPTIVVSSYSITDRRYERLVGNAARKAVGDLVEPPQEWEWRDELEELARRFAGAMRHLDRAELAALLSYGDRVEEARISQILDHPAYKRLREEQPNEIKIFTPSIGGRFRPSGNGHVFAYLCYCRTRDCTERWPISSRDADAGESRPYICISTSGRIAAPAKLDLYAPEGGGWLAEPEQTALQN